MKTLETLAAEFVALHTQDVRECPTAYKARVVADPEASARGIIDGLDASEVAEMIRTLKAERRALRKAV
jgi:hypothetical protein